LFTQQATQVHIDPRGIVVRGHSAGGHLALWPAGEQAIPLMGGSPEQFPERYKMALPIEHLPLHVPTRLIHGAVDDVVPMEIAQAYEAAALARNDDVSLVSLVSLAGVGHMECGIPACCIDAECAVASRSAGRNREAPEVGVPIRSVY